MNDKKFLSECCDHCEYNGLVWKNQKQEIVGSICELKRGDEFVFGKEDAPEGCPYKEAARRDDGGSA